MGEFEKTLDEATRAWKLDVVAYQQTEGYSADELIRRKGVWADQYGDILIPAANVIRDKMVELANKV